MSYTLVGAAFGSPHIKSIPALLALVLIPFAWLVCSICAMNGLLSVPNLTGSFSADLPALLFTVSFLSLGGVVMFCVPFCLILGL